MFENIFASFQQFAQFHPVLIAFGIFFVLLLCGFGLPLPEDVVLIFTGFVCYFNAFPLWVGVAIGMAGVLIGDSTLWWIGRRYGEKVLNMRLFKAALPPQRLNKIQKLYDKYHMKMLFAARFTPMLRSGVFLFAGWSGVSYKKFLMTDGTAALISVPTIIIVTYSLGEHVEKAKKAITAVEHWIIIGIAIAVAAEIFYARWQKNRERRLYGAGDKTTESSKETEEKDIKQNTSGR